MTPELVILRAADAAALAAAAKRVADYLDRAPWSRPCDVALTCAKTEGLSTLAIVCEGTADLRARLASAAARIAGGTVLRIRDKSGTYWNRTRLLGVGAGKLAFLYPGVPSFYPDMLRDLVVARPACRSAFDELEEAFAGEGAFRPSDFVFPPAPRYRRDADVFSAGGYAQAMVATYAANVALSRLLEAAGVTPDGVAGFAGGDLAAMVRAGALGRHSERPDRIRLLQDLYRMVDKAVDHAGLPETAVLSLLLRREGEADALLASAPEGMFSLASAFAPRQKTVVVAPGREAEALRLLSEGGIRVARLALNRPFNTPACENLVPAVRKLADTWLRQEPSCAVYSCATAAPIPEKLRKAREEFASRWAKPVLFADTIRRMHADGYRVFLEVGPRGLLASAAEDSLKGEDCAAIAMNSIHRRAIPQALHALAQLAALGASVSLADDLRARGAHELDFDATCPAAARRESEMRLSRVFPRLTLLSTGGMPAAGAASPLAEPHGRGAKAAARAAVIAEKMRRSRQFESGTIAPLVADADIVASSPGVLLELTKAFKVAEMPFLSDFALGTSQLSYADPNLKGLLLLTIPVALEIMAETAGRLVPGGELAAVEGVNQRRQLPFRNGVLALRLKAERVASSEPSQAAVKVQLREDVPEDALTWPVVEATFFLSKSVPPVHPVEAEPLLRPRTVHWSGREVYPVRLSCGPRLRGITFVESWSENGIDFRIETPPLAGAVAFTRFPVWTIGPLLLGIVTSGYPLWRSHERFGDVFAFPFRLRRLTLHGSPPKEGTLLNCYLRLAGVTPESHLCDIYVSDGNGNAVMCLHGWEERAEHVPKGYRSLVTQPATAFVSETVSDELLGRPDMPTGTALVPQVPYAFFDRSDEIWLKTFSHIILCARERDVFAQMSGSRNRRIEWLYGRLAAKEAVRRYLKDRYQARWSYADVGVFANDLGKPYVTGGWKEYLAGEKLDIAIAHTSRLVVALVAPNARIGVDVEFADRELSDEFAAGAFRRDERDLLASAPNTSPVLLRFWCAKEAVSKALGVGIRYSPKEMIVTSYDADARRLTVRLEGAWLEAFRNFTGRDIAVTVGTVHDHAFAFCSLPDSLFGGE